MSPAVADLSHAFLTRRRWLQRAGGGFGLIGLASLLSGEGLLGAPGTATDVSLNPMAARPGHFRARAKRVIWVFTNGGPSQVDTWEYKPALDRWHGKSMREFDPSFKNTTGFFKDQVGSLMKSPFAFTPRGESGKMVSEIFPELGRHVDKMAFVHSVFTESNNHSPALFMMNTGIPRMGFPCMGSWVTYGLGSDADNLPGFVVMSDPKGRGLPKGHAANWGAAFLPGAYQGTHLHPKGPPIDDLERPPGMTDQEQGAAQLGPLLESGQPDSFRAFRGRGRTCGADPELRAGLPHAVISARCDRRGRAEPRSIQRLYGIGDPRCDHFARQCLTARRLVERGVRFVQIYSGGMENERSWDGHVDIKGNHEQFAGETDQPVAGLLEDLEQRGLLDETLVIWGGEFGRLPVAQTGQKPGRDHNPRGFTVWLAGGGIKGGVSHGATDEIGYAAADQPVSINDLHATVLHLLGIDHERLTYTYNGRRFRLTDVAGKVITEILT